MEINKFLFPSPHFDFNEAMNYVDKIFLIPKEPSDQNKFIPCLFLKYENKSSNNDKILIIFHSNGTNIFTCCNTCEKIQAGLKINILIVEYPGYSLYNHAKPDSKEILADALIVYDYMTKFYTPKNIFLLGRSIGTAPSIYLASKKRVGLLIAISAFTSVRGIAENYVGGILKYFIPEQLASIDYVKNIKNPILLIHGKKDNMIPYSESIKLKNECCCPFEYILRENMTHNEFNLINDIIIPIRDFIHRFKFYIQDKENNLSSIKLEESKNVIEKLKKFKKS